ncbi:hypothetical protein AEYBE204_16495 [Asticcacaulis sp. YBE204]|nr:hypothetical protein AEYBE204_16495 [Asticcacaulis sp. YBE204]
MCLMMCGAATQAETRLALVIDQVGYSGNLSPLPGARQEADQVVGSLQKTGFQITRVHSATRPQLDTAFRDFRRQVSANPGAVVFIYYTGHGIRDAGSDTNDNYLLGVEADISVASDLTAYGVQLQNLTQQFSQTGASVVIFVLDACRTTPTLGKAGTKGLAPVSAAANTLVAYSTGAGDVADVGVYAPVLAEEMLKPGQDVIQLFSNVQKKVAAKTSRKQLPWSNNLIYSDICLVSCQGEQMAGPLPVDAQKAYEDGRKAETAGDYGAALTFYEQGCTAGNMRGCYNLASLYFKGTGVAQNKALAFSLYQKSCDGAFGVACRFLGFSYQDGTNLPKDYTRAFALLEKGCNLKDQDSCAHLAYQYMFGLGVPKDDARAYALYDSACKTGVMYACENQGRMHEWGSGLPKDMIKARSLYQYACDRKYPSACVALALTYGDTPGLTDREKTEFPVARKVALQKGCDLGYPVACDGLRK